MQTSFNDIGSRLQDRNRLPASCGSADQVPCISTSLLHKVHLSTEPNGTLGCNPTPIITALSSKRRHRDDTDGAFSYALVSIPSTGSKPPLTWGEAPSKSTIKAALTFGVSQALCSMSLTLRGSLLWRRAE